MSVKIRLYQEGHERSNGFQGTEWISDNGAHTDPARYQSLFVLKKVGYGLPDLFERVARDTDFASLIENPLEGFEPLGALSDPFPASATVLKVLTTTCPHWPTDTSVNGSVNTVDGLGWMTFPGVVAEVWKGKASGDGPPVVSGNLVTLSNYIPTDADVGRALYLTGFSNSGNNGFALVTGIDGLSLATNKWFTSETGPGTSGWHYKRYTLNSVVHKFPRAEGRNLGWAVYNGGALLLSGSEAHVARRWVELDTFRDLRYTFVQSTGAAVTSHFTSVQVYVEGLQRLLSTTSTAFGPTAHYDYGP